MNQGKVHIINFTITPFISSSGNSALSGDYLRTYNFICRCFFLKKKEAKIELFMRDTVVVQATEEFIFHPPQ